MGCDYYNETYDDQDVDKIEVTVRNYQDPSKKEKIRFDPDDLGLDHGDPISTEISAVTKNGETKNLHAR